MIWFVCVVAAITLFSVQVIERSREYFRYRSNVNVEMIYADEVEFPSVTICNQNNYRWAKLQCLVNFLRGVLLSKSPSLL